MTHDPEQLAAAYLTTMRPRARRRFEMHVLTCEPCWHEVSLARRGRQLAESCRDVAPAGLREDIRAAVTAAAQPTASPRPSRRIAVAAVIAVAVLAGAAGLVRPWPHSRPAGESAAPRTVIAAAVASYRADRLPGTAIPAKPAPELTPINLHLAGAAAGQLNGLAVTMFAYNTPSGARLIILVSSRAFPEAAEARELGGTDGAWTMRSSGVTIICAQGTHAMLLLGSDAALVRQAGALLHAI
jgi:anti-sigma factor RsiW